MTKDQLLNELNSSEYLDLAQLYQRVPHCHFYTLVEELYRLREESGLTTRISRFKTDIEKLTQGMECADITAEDFKQIVESLDFGQRTQKASRFIQMKDNHLTFAPAVDLVMYGDSITEWGPWHDGIQSVRLANRGLGGDTTDGMIQRIDTTVVCQPKLVCVMAGINDLAQGYSIEEIVDNYAQMLNYWHEKNINVWVQSTLHVGTRLNDLNPLVAQLNAQLALLCSESGAEFIDLNALLCPQGHLSIEYSADDLHLNSRAYEKWIALLTPKFEMYFNQFK